MMSACAFSRDSASPRSTISRSSRSLHDFRWTIRSASSCSRAARARRMAPAPGAPARTPPPPCGAKSPGHRPPGKVIFCCCRVLARRLAERLGRLFHVQNVVHNLKRQPDVLAVAGERLVLRLVGARVDARPCAGWRAAARRSWRDGWSPAVARRAACPSPSRSATCPPIMPPTVPDAVASSAIRRALAIVRRPSSFASTWNASVSSASPARIAMASPKTLWLVSLPRR